jgi:hypothetical protein
MRRQAVMVDVGASPNGADRDCEGRITIAGGDLERIAEVASRRAMC